MVEPNDQRGQKKAKGGNTNYGDLTFGKFPESNYKISLRTFFGNPESEVFSIRFDENDNLIAASNSDGSVKIFNLATGKLQYSLSGFSTAQQTPTTCVRWQPKQNGQYLWTANADGSLMTWWMKKGVSQDLKKNPCAVFGMDFNSEGNKFVVVGKDMHVRIYDTDSKQVEIDFPEQTWGILGHSNRIFVAKFIPEDPNVFITCGWDPTAQIWDLRERKVVGNLNGTSVSADSLDYKNGQVLCGSYRNLDQLQLFDFRTRTLIQNVNWDGATANDKCYSYCAQFSKFNDDTFIAGSSGVNELKIFNSKAPYMPVASIVGQSEGVYCCDYSQISNKFAFGGGEGVVYIMGLSKTQQ